MDKIQTFRNLLCRLARADRDRLGRSDERRKLGRHNAAEYADPAGRYRHRHHYRHYVWHRGWHYGWYRTRHHHYAWRHHRYHRYYAWNPAAAVVGGAIGLATLPFAVATGGWPYYYGYPYYGYPYYY